MAELTMEEAAEVAAICEGDWRPDYGGRGMYGRTCFAVTADNEVMVGYAIGRVFGDTNRGVELLNHLRRDSMGHGVVLYFPTWTVPAAPAGWQKDNDVEPDQGDDQ